jgi:hypothetical protein
LKSVSFDNVKICWNTVGNATSILIERYVDGKFDSVGMVKAKDTVFEDRGLTGNTLYLYRIKGVNGRGYSEPSVAVSVYTLPKPGPWSGTPALISGKIEAENYDIGPRSTAYYDTDDVNNAGKYRNDGVDVESCQDTGNGYEIGWIEAGEWVLYTVDVIDTLADIQLRVASQYGGKVRIELDGRVIAEADILKTGGWQSWKTITMPEVGLSRGTGKKLKLIFVKGGFNLNWIRFVKVSPVIVPTGSETGVENGQGISIFPNPATDFLKISSPDLAYTQIRIFTSEGKCLLSREADYLPENVLHFLLPDGAYILTLSNSEQEASLRFNVLR